MRSRGTSHGGPAGKVRFPVSVAGLVLALSLAGSLISCGGPEDNQRLTGLTLVSGSGTKATVNVEIAETREALARGLTGREGLAADEGMLFVIDERGPGFWMKDVGFPLTVAFISRCGKIVALADMEPYSLEFHDTEHDFRFGLEVNRGWFTAHGIGAGASVILPARLRASDCA